MKTKLVYVLTSKPDATYIEQALMSVYTARYHNPDACIVLVTDNLTNQLFVGKRSELLDYLTEKLVVDLPDEMPMMERSRQLKTSVRSLIEGDLLFIDCDTLITGSLQAIDSCTDDLAAVYESHLRIPEFKKDLFDKVQKNALLVGWDASKEEVYYSSGVIYAKDTAVAHTFFEAWNHSWKKGTSAGVFIDQPSFAKANIDCGYPVKRMDDRWNCVMYTHPLFDREAKIMHFCSFRNMSYAFERPFLELVRNEGVQNQDFVKRSVLHPTSTYIPFDNAIYHYGSKGYVNMFCEARRVARLLSRHLPLALVHYVQATGFDKPVRSLFHKKLLTLGAFVLVMYKFYRVKCNKKFKYVINTCQLD